MHRTYLTIIAVLVAVILYLTIVPRMKGPQPSEPTAAQPPSVAVLRFVALGDAGGADALADSISAKIVEGLRGAGISVAADSSPTTAGESIRAATERLGARYALEGAVSRTSGSLRVTAQLVDGETDAHLWSETYDRNIADVANVAEEIAAGVIRALGH